MSVLSDLLRSSNFEAPGEVRKDLASGQVDKRLVALLAALAERHAVRVSVVKTGHPMGSHSPAGRENDHFFFRAADITAIDGVSIGVRPTASGAVAVGTYLMALEGEARPTRVMGPSQWLEALGSGDRGGFREDEFACRIHADHLHLGF